MKSVYLRLIAKESIKNKNYGKKLVDWDCC